MNTLEMERTELELHVSDMLRAGLDPLKRYILTTPLSERGMRMKSVHTPIGDVDELDAILIKQTRAWRGRMRKSSLGQTKGRRSRRRYEQ